MLHDGIVLKNIFIKFTEKQVVLLHVTGSFLLSYLLFYRKVKDLQRSFVVGMMEM